MDSRSTMMIINPNPIENKNLIFKIYFNIAASYSFLNKFKDSIDYFDKALQIENVDNENKVRALMGKGNCYYRAKQLLQGGYENAYSIRMESDFEADEKTLDTLKKIRNRRRLRIL